MLTLYGSTIGKNPHSTNQNYILTISNIAA